MKCFTLFYVNCNKVIKLFYSEVVKLVLQFLIAYVTQLVEDLQNNNTYAWESLVQIQSQAQQWNIQFNGSALKSIEHQIRNLKTPVQFRIYSESSSDIDNDKLSGIEKY